MKLDETRRSPEPIAIVGMACRMPGAANPTEFWHLLCEGQDRISCLSPERWSLVRPHLSAQELEKISSESPPCWGGFLSQVERFDAEFFGISPREATSMEPQHRLLLEVAWEAMEDAALTPEGLAKTQTGVFLGLTNHDYAPLAWNYHSSDDPYLTTGTNQSIAASRISYLLNLSGPCVVVDTACSSSLVAIHMACQSIRAGESTMAFAGGVNLTLEPNVTFNLASGGFQASDGRCKTFDSRADGYVRGEGAGVILLKPLARALADGDPIYASILGSAVNHDGRTQGITAPKPSAQEAVLRQAYKQAGISPSQVQYVEAHGTGTSLGDPIELKTLGKVLKEGRNSQNCCLVGAVKTNIGHLESAAGIAGLIKVALSLQHRQIPPNLHFQEPNPYIPFDKLPVKIPQTLTEWPSYGDSALAGVSSFSFGGTNAHVVLQAAPKKVKSRSPLAPLGKEDLPERPVHLLTLSAKTEKALEDLVCSYQNHLETHRSLELADICFTANTGRSHFKHRLAIITSDQQELAAKLAKIGAGEEANGVFSGTLSRNSKSPKIAFLFTGQGSQYLNMGRQLYETQPVFRQTLDQCEQILQPYLEKSLLDIIYPENTKELNSSVIDQTAYTQPALFAIEYALFQLWQSWGIKPDVVMGHSIGEYVAATIAGVFSLEDGLKLIAHRGRLMQQLPHGGEMVAVMASEEQVNQLIAPYTDKVALAAINGPVSIVISGSAEAVGTVKEILEAEGIKTKQLQVSHAFHSPLMEPMLADFETVTNQITYHQPRIPLVSNVTGTRADESIATASYWVNHVRQPVKFAHSMETLHQEGYEVFLEIGPKPILLGMGRQCLSEDVGAWLPSLRSGQEDWQQMLCSLGELYVRGVKVDWSGFDRDYSRSKVVLPTYPWQRESYWFSSAQVQTTNKSTTHTSKSTASIANQNLPEPNDTYKEPITEDTVVEKIQNIISEISQIPKEKLNLNNTLAEVGLDSLMSMEMKTRLVATFPISKDLPLKMFFGGSSVEELIDFVSKKVKDTSGLENSQQSTLNLSPALARFQHWAKEFQPTQIVRIEKHLVHKHQEQNVLVSRIEQLEEDLIIGEVVQDVYHPFFYEHPKDHVPGLYIIEAARQFGTVLCHLYFNVPLNMPFVLDDMRTQFYKFAETNQPLFVSTKIQDKVYADGLLKHLQVSTSVIQNEETIALIGGIGSIFEPAKYNSLRKKSIQALMAE